MTEEKGYSEDFESELEEFVKENREMLEKLLEKTRGDECSEKIHGAKDKAKTKAEEKMKEVVYFATNPEMHSHFMAAGFQFMMGVNAAIKAMPLPDFVKESIDSMEEAREQTAERMRKSKSDSSDEKPKTGRIEISVSEPEEPQSKPKSSRSRKKAPEE